MTLDIFDQKFKNLSQAGGSPNLNMKSQAGKVSVSLQIEFDVPSFNSQIPSRSRRNGPSKQRRRERRAKERKAAFEETAATITPEEAVLLLLAEIAEKASDEESATGMTASEKDIVEPSEYAEESVTAEFKCDECELQLGNSGELQDHEERMHEVTSSPIPQIDGTSENVVVTKQLRVVEGQSTSKKNYPRTCEHCSKFLRNNEDFRKHIVSCMMSRKN